MADTDLSSKRSSKRARRSTGEMFDKKSSLQPMDLNQVLDSAKIKFETEQAKNVLELERLQVDSFQSVRKKASSAPASPGKSLAVSVSPGERPNKRPKLLNSSLSPRGRKSTLLMPATTNTESSTKKESPPEAQQSSEDLAESQKKQKKNSKGVSMSEVIRLHQDEGVINLLHALPASRRRQSTAHVGTATTSMPRNRQPNNEVERGRNKGLVQSGDSGKSALSTVLHRRHINPDNILSNAISSSGVQPCTQDELMIPSTMELLKQLPTKDYVRLWSSPCRYVLSNSASTDPAFQATAEEIVMNMDDNNSHPSPNGSVTSMESSVSKSLPDPHKQQQQHSSMPFVRTLPWRIQGKQYRDIHIRTYSSFVQVILSPATTGLRHSINANVCDELVDVLKQIDNDSECRAVLITGLGGTFCQGIDLTTLTHETSADRQKKSAEALAYGIHRLVRQLLDTSKVLVAAVNGKAVGLGVTILSYFDIVYASDKAEFSSNYARLGQMPDGFASQTKVAQCHEMLLMGQTLTATMAQSLGLVSNVILPGKFLEEVVPKVQSLEFMSSTGLRLVKQSMKKELRSKVLSVMDSETNALISQWSASEFAKGVRHYLKSSHLVFQ